MENNNKLVVENAMKRFQQILEYTTFGNNFVEEADEDNQNPEASAPEENAPMAPDGGMGDAPMGDMQGGPDMGGAPMGTDGDMGGDPNMDGDSNVSAPEGFNPQVDDNMMNGDPSMGDEMAAGPDDDVIDITDLTDTQEEMADDLEKMDDKFVKVAKAVEALGKLIKQNDASLQDLKAEYERRNPTPVEKLSMQTAHSYPFSVTPDEYWKEKEATSNYSTEDDNNGKEQGQYVITKDDVNGDVDWKGIADTLTKKYDPYHPTMLGSMGM